MRIACFNLSGTLVHHVSGRAIPLMPELLCSLHRDGWKLRIITDRYRDSALKMLEPVWDASGLTAADMEVGLPVANGQKTTLSRRTAWPERSKLGPAEALAHLEGILAVGVDVLVPAR